jgi:iron complex transport system substrate-binding protein
MFKSSLLPVLLTGIALFAAPVLAQDTQTVTDRMGREVKVPTEIDRIVTHFLPFPSAWFISTGSAEEIIGMHPDSKQVAERSLLGRIAPEVLNADTGFTEGNTVNVEELLRLSPDIFVSYETMPAIADVERIGVPVVAMDVLSNSGGNVIQTYGGWLELLGQLAGQQDRAAEIIAYANDALDRTRARVAAIPEGERPGALFFARLEENSLKINSAGHFGHFWVTEGGNRNLAPEGVPPLADIDMEQIYNLNPEVIFISNFSPTKPEDLYENRVAGQDWSHVKAVQNKRVYKVPEGIFQWYPPSADAPLMLQWIAQVTHPDVFNDYVIEDVIHDYYQRFYNYDLSAEDVALILDPQF